MLLLARLACTQGRQHVAIELTFVPVCVQYSVHVKQVLRQEELDRAQAAAAPEEGELLH